MTMATICKQTCAKCTCGRVDVTANANFAPSKRPATVKRVSFDAAAAAAAIRYKGSLDILA